MLEGDYFQEGSAQNAQLEVALTTLRVIRKIMMAGGAETAGSFGEAGGTATLVWYLECLAGMDDPLPQLALEGIRSILAAIALGQGDDPEAYLDIDETLNLMEQEAAASGPKKKSWFGRKTANADTESELGPLEKPEGPRGYEVISLDADGMAAMMDSVLKLMEFESLQKHLRFMRAALGYVAYLAAENVPGATNRLLEQAEAIGAVLRLAFEELGMNPELVLLVWKTLCCRIAFCTFVFRFSFRQLTFSAV